MAPSKAGRPGTTKSPRVTPPRVVPPSSWKSADATGSPASTYGSLDDASCRQQLIARGATFTSAPLLGAPEGIRLTGALHGVDFRGFEADKVRPTSPYEVIECRLALALDDFAAIVAAHDIRTVVHFGVYRPPHRGKVDPKNPHEHALAIDVARLVKSDGTVLDVDKDWHGVLGGTSCGPTATKPTVDSAAARELRAIVCEVADRRLFNVLLTPHYNPQHHNHFHFEVMPDTRWLIVR